MIGKTDDLAKTLSEASKAFGVPADFECFYAKQMNDADKYVKSLYNMLKGNRLDPNRIFFNIDPNTVKENIEHAKGDVVILNNRANLHNKDKTRQRADDFCFQDVKIPVGATLTFKYDDDLTCTVVDGSSKVNYKGNIIKLSGAARLVLEELDRGTSHVAGNLYWKYKGKLLNEMWKNTKKIE